MINLLLLFLRFLHFRRTTQRISRRIFSPEPSSRGLIFGPCPVAGVRTTRLLSIDSTIWPDRWIIPVDLIAWTWSSVSRFGWTERAYVSRSSITDDATWRLLTSSKPAPTNRENFNGFKNYFARIPYRLKKFGRKKNKISADFLKWHFNRLQIRPNFY